MLDMGTVKGLFCFVFGGVILFVLLEFGLINPSFYGLAGFTVIAALVMLVFGLLLMGIGISLIAKHAKD